MPAPSTAEQFLDLVQKSGVLDEKRLSTHLDKLRATGGVPPEPAKLAGILVRDGLLTQFQAERFLEGRWRRFVIGKYKVLERIASGGMGSVYLCEHKFMRRRAAVKVLPEARAADPAALARFYREARAVAALDHPNIVRAYDIDQEENLHFLVMEYVDGTSLQELVRKSGPLEPARAAHYISQAAMGLQHAHEFAGLIHRDIKPGNLIVDRGGIIKILDMGLARFFNDQDDMLTQKYDENVLGTADYLAPEQALDSHSVDIRADVYSLGATFYYCLTGKTPFSDGTVAQKLIWHQTRQPKPVRSLRQDVPEGIIAVIEKMMAKEPKDRYQTPNEVVGALAPWTQAEIAPPAEGEMPQLSPAAQTQSSDFNFGPRSPTPLKPPRGKRNKSWQIAENGSNPAVPQPMPNPPLAERSNPQSPKGAEPKRTAGDPKAGAPTLVAPPDLSGAENQDFGLSVSAAPATSQQIDEESIAWENLAAADTKESVAHLDTTATPKNPPLGNRPVSHSHISAADRRRL
ncbi:MAG TPA: protein kinase, partial [Gemmataceae bacterium]|nr:protein kinase [Gemmataceae bacterium]